MEHCGDCGTLRRNIIHDPNGSLDSLIKYYFYKEMAYQTVVYVLDTYHNIQTDLRTLNCKLKTMQLTKSPKITGEDAPQIIKPKLQGRSAEHGYRIIRYLENLAILKEGFTYATVQTI